MINDVKENTGDWDLEKRRKPLAEETFEPRLGVRSNSPVKVGSTELGKGPKAGVYPVVKELEGGQRDQGRVSRGARSGDKGREIGRGWITRTLEATITCSGFILSTTGSY